MLSRDWESNLTPASAYGWGFSLRAGQGGIALMQLHRAVTGFYTGIHPGFCLKPRSLWLGLFIAGGAAN